MSEEASFAMHALSSQVLAATSLKLKLLSPGTPDGRNQGSDSLVPRCSWSAILLYDFSIHPSILCNIVVKHACACATQTSRNNACSAMMDGYMQQKPYPSPSMDL